MLADVHQHIWTTPLLDALATRDALPFVRREQHLTVLHASGEQPYVIDVDAEAPGHRAALVKLDGLDLAAIALSSPIGIESLPREAATELIEAHLEGVLSLGEEFWVWGPVALEGPDPNDIDELLARGCVGISLPATALATRARLDSVTTLLQRASAHGAPLLVHPGGEETPAVTVTEPDWWRALTVYVAQMQAAWLTFATFGRRKHPELKIVFTMLAGGAPLLSERLRARGAPAVDLSDPLSFYDTSSYGPFAIDAMARLVGVDQLVYGSDRPVVDPISTGWETVLATNAGKLLASVVGRDRPRADGSLT